MDFTDVFTSKHTELLASSFSINLVQCVLKHVSTRLTILTSSFFYYYYLLYLYILYLYYIYYIYLLLYIYYLFYFFFFQDGGRLHAHVRLWLGTSLALSSLEMS